MNLSIELVRPEPAGRDAPFDADARASLRIGLDAQVIGPGYCRLGIAIQVQRVDREAVILVVGDHHRRAADFNLR